MRKFLNLVPDSAPVQEVIELLRANGGRASCVDIAEAVLQLPGLDPPLAALVLADFIEGEGDWRLRVSQESCEVELLCEDDECRQLGEADFVVFDVETTGPKTPPCRIMELGAIRVSRGRIVAEFQTLINPLMPIPPFIAGLTGISDAMVSNAPTFDEVAADWLDFADTAVLVAHNAPFDVRFINHELSRLYPGQRMANTHLCTVSLARRVMPELSSFRLTALAEHFAVPHRSRHRAGDDARATAEVFILLLEHLGRHGVQDIAGARRFRKQLSATAADSSL
jgi:DNA polymerase III epsilon subunit family exonuclease